MSIKKQPTNFTLDDVSFREKDFSDPEAVKQFYVSMLKFLSEKEDEVVDYMEHISTEAVGRLPKTEADALDKIHMEDQFLAKELDIEGRIYGYMSKAINGLQGEDAEKAYKKIGNLAERIISPLSRLSSEARRAVSREFSPGVDDEDARTMQDAVSEAGKKRTTSVDKLMKRL